MRLLFIIALICSGYFVNAQYSNLKGVAVLATRFMWVENGEIKTNNTDQCYTFSFKDKILCHTVYDDGSLSAAQFYRLNEALVNMDGDETVYSLKATSGVSGSIYTYEIKLDKNGKLVSMIRTQPDGKTKETFTGIIIDAKTILQ